MMQELQQTMQITLGEAPDVLIPDGKLHRFMIKGKRNGWYKCHADGRANGTFGDWSTGITERWMSDSTRQYTEAEKAEFKANAKRIESENLALIIKTQSEAAAKAQYIWPKLLPAPDDTGYLVRKGIRAHGARITRDGSLAIPLRDETLEVVSLSFIGADGQKRLLSGGKKKGCFFSIGRKPTLGGVICLSESFSTASTIFQQLGHQTFISFGADNLTAVAQLIRSKRPDAQIWLMSDNNDSGVGQRTAKAAADAVDGMCYVVPRLPDTVKFPTGNDWNDFCNAGNEILIGGVL